MQSFLLITLLCAIMAVYEIRAGLLRSTTHSTLICPKPSVARRLLIKTPVYESPGRNYETKTRIFKFPDNGYNKHKITCISLLDEDFTGKGAYAKIIGGGLCNTSIEIEFKSQIGQGINFQVELYAK